MKILDTDILVAILRGKKDTQDLLDYLSSEDITTTSITAFELYYGAFKSERASENIKEVDSLLSSYSIINFDKKSSKAAGEIYSKLEISGLNIGLRDVLIGAICIVNNATIITRNVKHYSRIEGLNIEKW
ncbi:MAG: PIN domain nuclease [Candidatus Altiarchaeales archaeon HGW-Altiarchaeales-1]|nr:MAG: PIN domain nuclease [Candidatus Altiarchaeales archaeon HGW-Altiarchaeales-2]PKP61345.1 MAG: PIN domain nuclease [Candidatus Altiarchaeales archaeon HGW-Altiarchaeales-1]